MDKVNLAPFYAEQRVVFIGTPGNGRTILTRGEIYTVSNCEYKVSSNPINVNKLSFWYVGIVGYHNGICCLCPSIFVPVKQTDFPALTFQEIVEAEKLEVLTAN